MLFLRMQESIHLQTIKVYLYAKATEGGTWGRHDMKKYPATKIFKKSAISGTMCLLFLFLLLWQIQ